MCSKQLNLSLFLNHTQTAHHIPCIRYLVDMKLKFYTTYHPRTARLRLSSKPREFVAVASGWTLKIGPLSSLQTSLHTITQLIEPLAWAHLRWCMVTRPSLLPMSPHVRMFESTESFARHVHDLHKEISKHIHESNACYKIRVDSHHWYLEFNVGDYVISVLGLIGQLGNCKLVALGRS